MNIAAQTIAVVILTGTILSCAPSESAHEQEIRACFKSVITGLQTGNADLAAGNVDDASFQYFADLRRHALRSAEEQVRSLSPTQKIMVFSMRYYIPADELEEMRTRDLIVYFIEEGLIGGSVGSNIPDIGSIRVEGRQATATMVDSTGPLPFNWEFTREKGSWKMNLTSIYDITDADLTQEARMSGVSEDELIITILEGFTEEFIPTSIWDPYGIESGADTLE